MEASQGPAELVFGWSAAFPTNSGKLHNCSAPFNNVFIIIIIIS